MFQRYGRALRPSTRYRDLVDLVAIVTVSSVRSDLQLEALASQVERRGLTLPMEFDVPDRPLWGSGYAAEAGRSLLAVARTLDEALHVVKPFIDPVLDGTAAGSWDPRLGAWSSVQPGRRS